MLTEDINMELHNVVLNWVDFTKDVIPCHVEN